MAESRARSADSSVSTRWHGIDAIRLVSMTAIVLFHSNETAFYTDVSPLPPVGTVYFFFEAYSRYIAFSGFTIAAVSGFLYGSKERARRTWVSLLALLLAGTLLLLWVNRNDGLFSIAFEWDIYPFLFCSLLVAYLASRSTSATRALGAIGLVLLWLPVWKWIDSASSSAWSSAGLAALVGNCETPEGGGWPLLPWAGIIWFPFALGREWAGNENFRAALTRPPARAEVAFWFVALAASMPAWGGYLEVPMGPGFSCFVFRRPPEIFWAHFIWVVFLARVSLIKNVNDALGSRAFFRWLSALHWSRHFGRCFILHLVFLGLGSLFAQNYLEHPRLFDLYLLGNMPVVEAVSRFLTRAGRRTRDIPAGVSG